MAKRWVIKGDNSLEIHTTSGQEPPNALCEAKDEWTIYNISYDETTGLVFYDPEKIARLQAKELEEARKKKFRDFKVNFIEHTNKKLDIIKAYWPYALTLVVGIALGIVAKLLVSLSGLP